MDRAQKKRGKSHQDQTEKKKSYQISSFLEIQRLSVTLTFEYKIFFLDFEFFLSIENIRLHPSIGLITKEDSAVITKFSTNILGIFLVSLIVRQRCCVEGSGFQSPPEAQKPPECKPILVRMIHVLFSSPRLRSRLTTLSRTPTWEQLINTSK